MTDVARLREALAGVQGAAGGLPWARERPWRTDSHVWDERGLPVVDLHDLGRKLASQAVRTAAALAPELDAASVCFITGAGRRSIGKGVLRDDTTRELQQAVAQGGYFRPLGPGRMVFVADPSRAPAAATGKLGLGFWLMAGLFAAAAVVASWSAC